MTEKDKFLKFFKKENYSEIKPNCFTKYRIKLSLEDNNWNDICFDFLMKGFQEKEKYIYITCITNLKELKKLLSCL
jgi:hypothetical protein